MNIRIVRTFTKIREMLLTHKDILSELEKIRKETGDNSKDIELIFKYLKQLEATKQQELEQGNRKTVGYKRKEEE